MATKVKKNITPERVKILALEKQGDSIEFPAKLRDKVRSTVGNVNRALRFDGVVQKDEIPFSISIIEGGKIKVIRNF